LMQRIAEQENVARLIRPSDERTPFPPLSTGPPEGLVTPRRKCYGVA
jgi:hypothetical protein